MNEVATQDSAPAEGQWCGAWHELPVRVYYEDTDAGGIVYHASYIRYAERGRSEMLRLAGINQRELLREAGIGFAVRRLAIDYLRPALLDDALVIASHLDRVGGARLEMTQIVRRQEEELVRLSVQIASIGRTGRPARLPVRVRERLSAAA